MPSSQQGYFRSCCVTFSSSHLPHSYASACRHNYHHFSKFFDAIQTAIQSGRFDEYRAWFLDVRSSSAQLESSDISTVHVTSAQAG